MLTGGGQFGLNTFYHGTTQFGRRWLAGERFVGPDSWPSRMLFVDPTGQSVEIGWRESTHCQALYQP